jgi:transposase
MQPPHSSIAAPAKRRQFSSREKRCILAVVDRCTETGEIGVLLCREGLYSSQLAMWRKQREVAEQAAFEQQKRGRKADPAIAESRRVAEITKENERRHQPIHPSCAKPELLALQPSEVWSWDITKLKGPAKWTC